jgi:uncharacterized protein
MTLEGGSSDRIRLIDALRGLSLAGIAMAHFGEQLQVATFALLFLRPRWQPRLLCFGPVGRMALSAYVGQTVIGTLVFFGFGLGWLGRFGNGVTIPLGLFVFVAQVRACRAWLGRFRYGPLEWAWRSLTWLRRQPFRAAAGAG